LGKLTKKNGRGNMTHIINLEEARKQTRQKSKKPFTADNELTALLKKAVSLKNLSAQQNKETITNLTALLQSKMSEIIIERNLISNEYFLCSIYISDLLSSIVNAKNIPKSWFAIDYIIENHTRNNPQIIKQGANACLLICTLFQGRAEIKMMTMKDYLSMGATLFHQFYSQTGAEIGYYMSQEFETMVEVTNECVRNL